MPRRILQGVVVSDKNEKTVVVSVERRLTHPVLKKTVRLPKKYHAHDEENRFKEGAADLQEEAVEGCGTRGRRLTGWPTDLTD